MVHKVRMDGKKLSFANLPKDMQDKVLDRLVEKHPGLGTVMETGKLGIKFDGKEVGYDNIKEFEKPETAEEVPKYTEKDLFALNKKEQIVLISKLGYSKKAPTREAGRVKLILKLQEE